LTELLVGNLFGKAKEMHHAHRLIIADLPIDREPGKTIDDKMIAEDLFLLAFMWGIEGIVRPRHSLTMDHFSETEMEVP
jgi:hypothetical protein